LLDQRIRAGWSRQARPTPDRQPRPTVKTDRRVCVGGTLTLSRAGDNRVGRSRVRRVTSSEGGRMQNVAERAGGLSVRCQGLVHLYKTFEGHDVVALQGVDLTVDAGERVAFLGPSGS